MRPLIILVVALLAGSSLAGCIQDKLSAASVDAAPSVPDQAAKTLLLRVPLTTKDGAKLDIVANMSADAKASGEKLPVIVDIGPYYSTGILQYTAIDQRMADYFVPRGYVMARAALRGTGESTGCFDLGGKQEQQDVHDIVEWLGTQPWSNGNVAVFGKSYDGTTPWEAAISQPSHLKTIVPISGITDMYRYTFYDGTTYPEEVGFEPYYYLFVGDDMSIPGPDGGTGLWSGNQQTLLASINPCEPSAFAQQSLADGGSTVTGDHGDAFWQERDYENSWDKIQVPVFDVHGMQDWNVKLDNEVPMFNKLHVPKAAWFGQWEHNYPDVNTFKPEWSRHDWNETLLTWFDHWLKGKDNDISKIEHVEAQDQSGNWSTYADDAWPPTSATDVPMVLSSSGALSNDAGEPKTASFQDPMQKGYDPAAKANGLGFATGPMSRNVTILGQAWLDLKMSIDRPDGNAALVLYDIDESGKWTPVDHGMRNLRHRDSRETGEPVTPNVPFNTTVSLYPEEIVIAKGHRLGFSVASDLPAWIESAPLSLGGTTSVQLGRGGTTLHVLACDAMDAATLQAALASSGAAPAQGALGATLPAVTLAP